jgi:hypothetical protein
MVDVRKAFPSKYISASDLMDGEPLTAQIVSAGMESFRTGDPALMLTQRHNGPQPKMVRANHNRNILSAAWGPDTDNWINHKVELTVTQTAMGPGIAMRPIADSSYRARGGPSWNDPAVTERAAPPSYPPSPNPMPQKPRKPVGGGPIDDDPVPFTPCVQ